MLPFVWGDTPRLLRAGELRNSTASGVAYLEEHWETLREMHLNCVLAPVYWELMEPHEGAYCFDGVDALLRLAWQSDMKLILLWFGAWKNGSSAYAPGYVKTAPERFVRCRHTDGRVSLTLSPFCEETCHADSRAFAALMRHLRKADVQASTVLAVQVENEAGFLGGVRDTSPCAQERFTADVPAALGASLTLQGSSWGEAFHEDADECFMAWGFASAVNEIAAAGKAEYALPMFVNAWTEQYPGEPARLRPCGGPAAAGLRVWRAVTPQIDAIVPDCYLEDLAAECTPYRQGDEPMLIPELRGDRWAPAFILYALGELHAVGAAPFGVESLAERIAAPGMAQEAVNRLSAHNPAQRLSELYRHVEGLESLILAAQAQKRIRGVLHGGRPVTGFRLGGYHVRITFTDDPQGFPAGGLILSPQDGEFYLLGLHLQVEWLSENGDAVDYLYIEEGAYIQGEWAPTRRLNGDERHVALTGTVTLWRVRVYSPR